MNRIASAWRITWDPDGTPWQVVEIGDDLADELEFPMEQQHIERRVPERDVIDYLPRKQVSASLDVSVIADHADDATARNYILAQQAARPWGLRKVIEIEADGGDIYRFSGCMLKSSLPRMVVDTGLATTIFRLRFLCGALSLVP